MFSPRPSSPLVYISSPRRFSPHGWLGSVIRVQQPSPALLPDRCQQGAAALAWVSPTTTALREWGNQSRVIYVAPEHAGQHVRVCVFVSVYMCMFRSPPLFLQHPAIYLLWHVKLNLWANLFATDMFDSIGKWRRNLYIKKTVVKVTFGAKWFTVTLTLETNHESIIQIIKLL